MNSSSLKKLYYQMLRIRLTEERIAAVYPEQEMRCPVHLCIGQEAIAVGVCENLNREDYVLSAHRSHGHFLAKGGDLKAMLAEFFGKVTGCDRGKGGSMHLVDLKVGFLASTPIVASTIPIAVGAAFAAQLKGEKRVTTVFFGEAATEEGTFHEAVEFALLKKLSVLFVCENNLYSVYSPLEVRQPKERTVDDLARGHGLPVTHGDGNDIQQAYHLAQETIEKIRRGTGPRFLSFDTYRWREHCGPNYDNDIGYRTPEEFAAWKKQCPLERFQKQLKSESVCTQNDLAQMEHSIQKELDEAVAFAKNSAFPGEEELTQHIYAPA